MGCRLWGRTESDTTEATQRQVCHRFSPKEQVSFNCVAEVTVFSDFGAHENKGLSAKKGVCFLDQGSGQF